MTGEDIRKWMDDNGLIAECDAELEATGRIVCRSCNLWNCWHNKGELCDVHGCQCELGAR